MANLNVTPKRQRRRVGEFLRIDLGDEYHTYARVIEDASYIIYDARTREELPVAEIATLPHLFQIAVMKHAVTRGRWRIIGQVPLTAIEAEPLAKFIQDPIRPEQFQIYEHGEIRPATRDECTGLERAAVWEPEGVEERIRDHYAGRVNKVVEIQKIRDEE
jgi:hypothetical protein